jgi:hypothetical protein
MRVGSLWVTQQKLQRKTCPSLRSPLDRYPPSVREVIVCLTFHLILPVALRDWLCKAIEGGCANCSARMSR